MLRLRTRYVSTILLLGSLPTLGETADEPRIEAILSTWANDDVACDYVYTHSADDEPEIVEQYSMSDGWSLLAVDGQPPSSEEVHAYHSDERRQSRARRSVPRLNLSEHIDPESATVTSENDETLTIEFLPRLRDSQEDMLAQKMNIKMRGHLTVARVGLQPLAIKIELVEPVAVAVPPVRVFSYEERRSFVVDPDTGVLLVGSVDWASRGRAFYFKKVSNSSSKRLDYGSCRFVDED